MLTKRIIACLDVDAGRVVKGTQFLDLRDAGDPAELAAAPSDLAGQLPCPVAVAARVKGSSGGLSPRQTTCMSGRSSSRSRS